MIGGMPRAREFEQLVVDAIEASGDPRFVKAEPYQRDIRGVKVTNADRSEDYINIVRIEQPGKNHHPDYQIPGDRL